MRLNSKLPVHSDPHTVLEAILDRHPLIVQSTVSYKEAVELMGATWSSQCQLSQTDTQSDSLQLSEVTSNALLVLSEQKFQGIFTERDLVRIASNALFSETHTVGELVREAPVTLKLRDFQDIFSVVHLMRQHQIRDLPILSETEQVIGIISFERIRQILQPIDLLKFRQIKEVMISDVICASPGDTVQSVTRLLTEHQISSVVITDSSGTTQDSAEVDAAVCRPVGIITERDIVQYQFLELNLENIQVAQVMSTPLFLIQTHDSIWQAHRRMQEKQIRRLVVVDQAGQLAGILTQSQILQILDPSEMYDIMTMLQQQVHNLQNEKEALLLEKSQALEDEMAAHLRLRLLTEEMLSDSEESYRVLAANLPAAVYRLFPHQNNRIIFLNDYVRALTGFNNAEIQIGEFSPMEQLILEEEKAQITARIREAIAAHRPYNLNYRITDKSGHVRYLWEQAQPVLTIDQDISHYDGVIFDFTERKEIEQAFQIERDFNAAILETAGALVLVLDLEGNIIRFNAACSALTGYTIEELEQESIWNTLIPEDELAGTQAIFQQLLQGQYPNHHQNHWLDKAGKEHLISWSNTVLTDANGTVTHIIATGIDKSETQQLEQQFLRAQRLESIGTLASGIAHDLNNILTPILAISQLLPLKLPDLDEQNQHLLEMMQESARRGSTLINQVLTFSRGIEGDRTTIQMRHIIAEIRDIARKTFPKSIQITVDVSRDLWCIQGDPTQLHQVLMNLCVNARDAMATGGDLAISAINLQIDSQFVQSNLEAQVGQYVLITVSDTGCGISKENQDKIFEPFFTTKVPGQGTGLGLSTVHGIIKNHGGFTKVYSEVDKGSQFQIYLPAIDSDIETIEVNPDLPRGNRELILVVDDEEPIREITRDVLETYNYQVLTGSDGIEAIAIYAQHSATIDAVLMNMTMPSMDGVTAIQTLQKLNPDVRLILTSGLASNAKLAGTLGDCIKAFIAKPFSSATLLNTLSNVLKSSPD